MLAIPCRGVMCAEPKRAPTTASGRTARLSGGVAVSVPPAVLTRQVKAARALGPRVVAAFVCGLIADCVYYNLQQPCSTYCIPAPGDVEFPLWPGANPQVSCPPKVAYAKLYFHHGNTTICAPGTGVVIRLEANDVCQCGTIP
jgi:hypothetical protein